MSEKVKITFKMDPTAGEEEQVDYASTVKELNSIPDVTFTPEGGLFGIGDTIRGLLGIPDVGKSVDKGVGVLGKWLTTREGRLSKRSMILEKGEGKEKIKVIIRAEGLKEGERDRIIRNFLLAKVSRKKKRDTSSRSQTHSTKARRSRTKQD